MKLVAGELQGVKRLGILAGSFNPPTRAHLALADAALAHVDRVLLVLPRVFPHKHYDGATLEQRIELLRLCAGEHAIGISEGGLFIDIAREAREYCHDAQVFFLCGRDAAQRIVEWDYGAPEAFAEMTREFHLLVAPRGGRYEAPPHLRHAIHELEFCHFDEHSSTAVRERIRAGETWEHLVPESIVTIGRGIYG